MPNEYLTLSDHKLVDLLKSGDQRAFSQLYERYFDSLSRQAYNVLGEREGSRDAVQDVFTALWERRATLNITESLKGYLYQMTRNAVLLVIRNNRRLESGLEALGQYLTTMADPADFMLRNKQLEELIQKAVAGMPARMREIYQLSRDGGYTQAQIAERMGISILTVKSQMHRALAILRKKLVGFVILLVLSWLL